MTEPEPKPRRRIETSGVVAIILAVGITVALNVVTTTLLWAAVTRLGADVNAGLSDNGVQILLAWGGGIISVIAGYTGYVVGKKTNGTPPSVPEEKP